MPPPSVTISDWLHRETPPDNLYELLSVELFDPDLEGLRRRVRDASRELLAWQNHSDPARAQRVMQLQRALGNAQDVLAAPERLDELQQRIVRCLTDRYAAHACSAPSVWRDHALREWLRSTAGVHDASVADVANRLLGSGSRDRASPGLHCRPQPPASWTSRWLMRQTSRVMRRPLAYAIVGGCIRTLLRVLPRFVLYNRCNGWGRDRELPSAPKHSFRYLWKRRSQSRSASRASRSAG
jgi:hypothetical protein